MSVGYFWIMQYKINVYVDKDESEFKDVASNMYRFLKKVDEIKPKSVKQDDGAVLIVTKEITDYVLKRRIEFERLKTRLENFISEFPTSEWCDDAMLFLGVSYLSVNLKEVPFTKDVIIVYRRIIDEYKELNIEPWTKKTLNGIRIGIIFNPIPGEEWTENLEDRDRIKVYFSRAIITEYLKMGNFEKAKLLLARFKDRDDSIALSGNIKNIKNYIENWEVKKDRININN
jgi:hypothetical protein